jgi:2'-5' RNA ligase
MMLPMDSAPSEHNRFAAAVIIPEPISGLLEALQKKYALKPWHSRIPLHITLVSPFETHATIDEIGEMLGSVKPRSAFTVRLNGFGRFDGESSVCYAAINPGSELRTLADDALESVLALRGKRSLSFVPHVTLADKDSREVVDGYMKRLGSETLDTSFTCDRFVLLKFDQTGNAWDIVREIPFTP